jgi:protein ImuA
MDISRTIADLRTRVCTAPAWQDDTRTAPLGVDEMDAALGGGLRAGALHEIHAAAPADAGAAAGLALGFASRLTAHAQPHGAPLLWLRQPMADCEYGHPHAPGLAEAGLDPRRLTLVAARRMGDLLDAALQAMRGLPSGVVLLEPWGQAKELDMTAARRLALAAEASGTTMICLFTGREPCPSPALSRWRVAAAPATAGPRWLMGRPRIRAELIRSRTGRTGEWCVEWDSDACVFRPAEISRHPAAIPADGSAAADHGGNWRAAG